MKSRKRLRRLERRIEQLEVVVVSRLLSLPSTPIDMDPAPLLLDGPLYDALPVVEGDDWGDLYL